MPTLDEIYTKPQATVTADEPLDLNLELLKQYAKAKRMLQEAEDEPLNYRVQALNAISSIISQLVKLQADLYQIEEIKKIELALAQSLRKFPEVQQEFLATYKGALDL